MLECSICLDSLQGDDAALSSLRCGELEDFSQNPLGKKNGRAHNAPPPPSFLSSSPLLRPPLRPSPSRRLSRSTPSHLPTMSHLVSPQLLSTRLPSSFPSFLRKEREAHLPPSLPPSSVPCFFFLSSSAPSYANDPSIRRIYLSAPEQRTPSPEAESALELLQVKQALARAGVQLESERLEKEAVEREVILLNREKLTIHEKLQRDTQ